MTETNEPNFFDLEYINSPSVSFNTAKDYLLKYFIVLNNGNHAMLQENGTYQVFNEETINKVYLKRLPKVLKDHYLTKNLVIRKITYELNKETLYGNYLNLCPKMKHQYKEYSSFPENTKSCVNEFLTFIKEIIVGNNNDSFLYVLKWVSNMVKGNKNDSCIYLKGIQGLGKSTFTDF